MSPETARSNCSQPNFANKAARLVDDTATHIRNRGFSRKIAIVEAAAILGINPNRAKKMVYGEFVSVALSEYYEIHERFLRHLEEEEAYVAERLEVVKKKLKAFKQSGL